MTLGNAGIGGGYMKFEEKGNRSYYCNIPSIPILRIKNIYGHLKA